MTPTPALHILVVEDNDSLRQATVNFLCQHGHQAAGVVSAEDVDDMPTRDLPDLYLIDVNLPGENGFALAERIRQSQPLAGIVLMTARGQLSDRLEGYGAGAYLYLTKPVEQAELLLCIRNLAQRLKPATPVEDATLVLHSQQLNLSGPTGQVTLNHGECLLLDAFCRAAGHKLEHRQAMQLVDTQAKGLVPANLEMRISALRKKLSACGDPSDAIRTLRGYGYALSCAVTIR